MEKEILQFQVMKYIKLNIKIINNYNLNESYYKNTKKIKYLKLI